MLTRRGFNPKNVAFGLGSVIALDVVIVFSIIYFDIRSKSFEWNNSVLVFIYFLISLLIWLTLNIIIVLRQKHFEWFSPAGIFFLLVIFSSFGKLLLTFLWEDLNITTYINKNTIFEQMMMVIIGLIGLSFGILIAETYYIYKKGKITKPHKYSVDNLSKEQLNNLKKYSYFIIILTIISTFVGNYYYFRLGLQYGENQFASGMDYYLQLIGVLLFMPAFVIAFYTNVKLNGHWANLTTVGGFAIFVLLNAIVGDRGVIITSFLALVISYHYLVKKLKFIHLLIALLLFTIFSSVVVTYRTYGFKINDGLVEIIKFRSFLYALGLLINDIGSPGFINSYLLEWYPKIVDFHYGRTYLDAIFSLIPGFFFGGKLVRPFISPTLEFKYLYEGNRFNERIGYGYSLMGEAYVNFGWIGIFIILLIIGFSFHYFYKMSQNQRNSWWYLPVFIIIYSIIPFNLRADAISLYKLLFYGCLVVLISTILVKLRSR